MREVLRRQMVRNEERRERYERRRIKDVRDRGREREREKGKREVKKKRGGRRSEREGKRGREGKREERVLIIFLKRLRQYNYVF